MNDAEAAESKQDLMSAGLNGIAQQKKPRLHRDLLIDFGRLILRRQRKIDEEIVKMMFAFKVVRVEILKRLAKFNILVLSQPGILQLFSRSTKGMYYFNLAEPSGYTLFEYISKSILNEKRAFITEIFIETTSSVNVARICSVLELMKDVALIALPHSYFLVSHLRGNYDGFQRNTSSNKEIRAVARLLDKFGPSLRALLNVTSDRWLPKSFQGEIAVIDASDSRYTSGKSYFSAKFYARGSTFVLNSQRLEEPRDVSGVAFYLRTCNHKSPLHMLQEPYGGPLKKYAWRIHNLHIKTFIGDYPKLPQFLDNFLHLAKIVPNLRVLTIEIKHHEEHYGDFDDLYYDDDDDNAHNDGNGGGAGGGETNYVPDELVPFLGAVETTVQWLRENRSAFPPPLERVTFCSEFSLDFVVAPGEDRPKLLRDALHQIRPHLTRVAVEEWTPYGVHLLLEEAVCSKTPPLTHVFRLELGTICYTPTTNNCQQQSSSSPSSNAKEDSESVRRKKRLEASLQTEFRQSLFDS